MVQEMSYTTIANVVESWEKVRRLGDYETKAGSILFQQLFKRDPRCKAMFGFRVDADTDSEELLESKRFLIHASSLMQMLDTALQMLGPDSELLEEMMEELGAKHLRYGVKADMFPALGEALIFTLEATLQKQFTLELRESWLETYKNLSDAMIRGQMPQMPLTCITNPPLRPRAKFITLPPPLESDEEEYLNRR